MSTGEWWSVVISALSLLVAGVSLWVAIRARWLAGKVGPLAERIQAIEHLRTALAEIQKGDLSSALKSIIKGVPLTRLVFSKTVRDKLKTVYELADRYSKSGRKSLDYVDLQDKLLDVIGEMNNEGALSGPMVRVGLCALGGRGAGCGSAC